MFRRESEQGLGMKVRKCPNGFHDRRFKSRGGSEYGNATVRTDKDEPLNPNANLKGELQHPNVIGRCAGIAGVQEALGTREARQNGYVENHYCQEGLCAACGHIMAFTVSAVDPDYVENYDKPQPPYMTQYGTRESKLDRQRRHARERRNKRNR